MNSTQFCYWLMGWFENAEPTTISEKQTTLIKEHLALVMDNKHEKANAFCQKLNGLFGFMNVTEFDQDMTQRLLTQLQECFKKDIDSKYSDDEANTLNAIHNGSWPSNDGRLRC